MNKTNTYSTILGGCWREKVVSDFGFGHSKSHFWAPENGHFWQKCPFLGAQKWVFECPNRKTETTFSRQHPPKMVEQVFVLFIYHFWTRNRQILNFEHFELFFARFYSVKRAFSTKWWPSEENAPKIIFFAFLVYFYINTKYIKLDRNSENFLIFWCTLMYILLALALKALPMSRKF